MRIGLGLYDHMRNVSAGGDCNTVAAISGPNDTHALLQNTYTIVTF